MQERVAIGTVDVVVPTFRPDDKFFGLLDALRSQTVRVAHVWVVNTDDGQSVSLSVRLASCYGDWVTMRCIPPESFDHGAARNLGASLSSADYLLFMTQDAVPAGGRLVETLLEAFADSSVAVAYARQLPAAGATLLERLERGFNYPGHSQTKRAADLGALGIKTYFCSNVCALYSKRIFDELGTFPENMIFNEDMVYASRAIGAGYAVCYRAEAEVVHSHDYGASRLFGRYFDLGVSQRQSRAVFESLPSVGEGGRLVRFVVQRLLAMGEWGALLRFFARSAAKFAGYSLGKRYDWLPLPLCRRLSSFPAYWRADRGDGIGKQVSDGEL